MGLEAHQTVEAEIADCCQALYMSTDPESAMRNWVRLRELTARRAAEETSLFNLESHNGDLISRST